ncbi:MAG: hypothetical protein EA398_10325 [Deltaproteobacteria bacterium]|nr:MAG: hypothetical protein EA398_10325 [Deltaproteobacteria bacterium]
MTTPAPLQTPTTAAPLPEGAIVDGRWHVDELLHAFPGGAVLARCVDRALDDRALLGLLLPPGTASPPRDFPAASLPVVDRVRTTAGTLLLLHASPFCMPLDQALGGLGREARAQLIVQLAEAHAEDDGCTLLLSHPGVLCAVAQGRTLHLGVVAVPAPDAEDEARARRSFIERLVRARLYGIDPDVPADVAHGRLPEPVADVLRSLDGPGAPAALARVLAVDEGSPPPLRGSPPAESGALLLDRWADRGRGHRVRAGVELAALALMAVVIALLYRPLLERPVPLASTGTGQEEQSPHEARTPDPPHETEAPTPIPEPVVTAAPSPARGTDGARPHAVARHTGPVPHILGPIPPGEEHGVPWRTFAAPPEQPFALLGVDGLARRMVHVQRNDAGDLLAVEYRTPHGDLAGRLEMDAGAGSLRWMSGTGRPLHPGCVLTHSLDGVDRWERLACLDEDGIPSTFPRSGVHEVLWTWRDGAEGLMARREALDPQGAPAALLGAATADERTWDPLGRLVRHRTLGPDGAPRASASGRPATWHFLHEPGRLRIEGRSEDGVAAPLLGEVVAVDIRSGAPGEPEVIRFLGEDGHAVSLPGSRVHAVIVDRCPAGRRTGIRTLDRTRRPTADALGVHRMSFVPGSDGHAARICHFGPDDLPVASDHLGGAHCLVLDEDERGRRVRLSAFGTDGAPRPVGPTAHSRWERRFDSANRPAEAWVTEPEPGTSGPVSVTRVRYHWDDRGLLSQVRFLGEDGRATEDGGGVAGYRLEHGPDSLPGDWILRCAMDEQWRHAPSLGGFGRGATCVAREVDARGVRTLAFLDAEGDPVQAELGGPWLQASLVRFERGPDGSLQRQVLLGVDGVTILDQRTCANRQRACINEEGTGWHVPGAAAVPAWLPPWWPGDTEGPEPGGDPTRLRALLPPVTVLGDRLP